MFPRLHVMMLGRFELWEESSPGEDGERRALPLPATARSLSLLAYLLLHRNTPQPRDVLAEIFWPGRPPQRARRSLSTALWRIRRSFAPTDPLECDHKSVQISFPGPVTIDAEVFEAALKEATSTDARRRAIELYEGEFLPGIYDDWVVRERNWLQALYQNALLQVMADYETAGDVQAALKTALQVLEMDACNEAAHRTAMRTYAQLGQRSAALEQYHQCETILARELDVAPSAETVAQYQALLAQKEPAQPRYVTDAIPAVPAPSLQPVIAGEDVPPLVGREQELARLLARWDEAAAGQGRMLFLRGEAGIGKTRLLATLADRVQSSDGWTISVPCYEYERGEPYGALVDVVRTAVALGKEDLIRELSSWQIANLARLTPELQAYLPADARYIIATEAEQRQMLRSLTRLLVTLAQRRPLLLMMDDLQWAHESSLAWLPMLARETRSSPLMVVGAFRIEEVAPGDMLSKIVTELETEKLAECLDLGRLSIADLAQWLQRLDGEVVARIHRHTEGNPFFVLETLRTLLEQGRLRRVNGGYQVNEETFELPLPDSVRQAILIRLDGLTPVARQGLTVAAVIGRVFDLDVWMGVWQQSEETALTALDELLKAHLLEERADAFTRDYGFEHHLAQTVVYQDIPKRRRAQLHLATARTLEKLRGSEPGAGAEIAFHYLRAGEHQQARPWLLRAGDQAVAMAATGEALRFYTQALAGYPQNEAYRFQRAVLERKIGETHFRRGEYEQAEEHLLQALALLERSFPESGLSLHRAVSVALARQTAHRIISTAGRGGRTAITPALREEVAAYTSLGWMYSLQSRYEEYLLVSLRALNESEDAGYARGIAVAATALGLAADFMARFGLATSFHNRAKEVVSQIEQPADAGFVAFGQSYHAYLIGDEGTMLTQAILAAETYRKVGDAHRWGLAMTLQAYVQAYRGELDEVRQIGEELIKAGEDMQDLAALCAGELLQGLTGYWRGDWEQAAAHYRQAVDLAERIPDHMNLVENLAGLTRCLLRLGRWPEAQEALARAREMVTQHEIKGDVAGKFSVCAFETTLWAAEHLPDARTEWLGRARAAMREARKQARAFRPAEPETWRLCGRYEWLCGRPDAARAWWEKSLARAEELDHRLDWGVTALEMGLRLGDETLRDAGRARLEEAGAMGAIAFLR